MRLSTLPSAKRVRRLRASVPQLLVLTLFMALALAPAALALGNRLTPPTGPDLYAKYCANCHGRYEKTLLPNRSASRIRSAIRHFPAMFDLNDLGDAEIETIAAALAGSPIAAR